MASRVYVLVFRFLTPQELLQKVAILSKAHKAVADCDELWMELATQTFGPVQRISSEVSWQQEYLWRLKTRSVVRLKEGQVELTQLPSQQTVQYDVKGLISYGEVCWLWTGQLLEVGGQENAVIQAATVFISVYSLKCTPGPSMAQGRILHALVARFPFVYVFGGYNYHSLSACEKLNLREQSWSALPNMSQPRRAFTPAVLGTDIYLVGGANMQIERFSTEQDSFEALGLSLNEPYTSVLGLAYSDILVFLNSKTVTEVQVTQRSLQILRQREVPMKDWRGSAVVLGTSAYLGLTVPEELFILDLGELKQRT